MTSTSYAARPGIFGSSVLIMYFIMIGSEAAAENSAFIIR